MAQQFPSSHSSLSSPSSSSSSEQQMLDGIANNNENNNPATFNSPFSSPRLAGGLRHTWLLRPDPEWQRRMEQLLGNTNQLMMMRSGMMKSLSSSLSSSAEENDGDDNDDDDDGDDADFGVQKSGGRTRTMENGIGIGNNIRRLEPRRNGPRPNDSFLAAIKQILLSMH